MDISDVIVRYKSQILLSHWEIEISDVFLLWATNPKYF